MIGLELTTARALKDTTATALASLLPTGDKQDDKSIQMAIDALLEADRQLVLKELTSAMLSGGDASRILKAHINIADVTAHIAAGDFAEAVLDYKKAGTNAVKAQ